MLNSLGLDEALLTLNKSTSTSLLSKPVVVYYQISECFGCQLEKFKTLLESVEDFVISTKHELRFEFRNEETKEVLCGLDGLNLNNHGHYKIDIKEALPGNGSTSFDCRFQTLDKGDCMLCPFAMLITFLLLVTVAEKVYSRFLSSKRRRTSRKLSDSPSGQRLACEQTQQASDSGVEAENGGSGQVVSESCADVNSINFQAEAERSNSGARSRRVESLDAFRGLTIAGMIMVNYGGAGYSILQHKAWDGITLADFVFPFFIFSMGASIAISTRSMLKRGKTFNEMACKVIRRSVLLVVIGLCLNSKALDGKGLNHLRITGVLQRFAISYLVVAFIFSIELTINKWIKAQSLYRVPILSSLLLVSFEILTAINYLFAYIYVTFYFQYSPECPIGYVGPGGQTEGGKFANCTGGAAAWLDKYVLGEQHLYNDRELRQIFKTQVTHDPEGILGNATSVLLTLMGLQCGKILIKFRDHKTRLFLLTQWWAFLSIGSVLAILIPINKRLWSLTFVTLTGSSAFLIIILLYLLMEVLNCERTFLLRLILSAGKNSIFLYVGHSLLSGLLPWYFAVDETSHLQLLLRLAWSTFVWLLVAHYMASKKVFIKL